MLAGSQRRNPPCACFVVQLKEAREEKSGSVAPQAQKCKTGNVIAVPRLLIRSPRAKLAGHHRRLRTARAVCKRTGIDNVETLDEERQSLETDMEETSEDGSATEDDNL